MTAARRAGLVTFAGIMFIIVGLFNLIDGLVAIAEPRHFYVPEGQVVVSSYTALGVVLLIVAALQLLVGFGILARLRAAQVVGLIVVIAGAIVQLAAWVHHPVWATIILVINAIIIYALVVYNDEFATEMR